MTSKNTTTHNETMSTTTNSDKPSNYRVSTITFNGDLSAYIQGNIFFEHVSMVQNTSDSGFVWVECWTNGEQKVRGVYPKKKKKSTKKIIKEEEANKNKSFDNQTSMYYRFEQTYIPHVKLFKNGNIHVTGLRKIEDGERILNIMYAEVTRIFNECDRCVVQGENISQLKVANPVVRLINSDFEIPFKIRRKELHQMLIAPPYNNICSFQPGTYPGVKLEFYWNKMHPQQDGRCRCEKPCFGKGTGKTRGDCKKVTVAVFDSGSVLITGATSHQQVNDAYTYICDVILQNTPILKKNIPTIATSS